MSIIYTVLECYLYNVSSEKCLETAAGEEAQKIGGKAQQVLAPGALTGADANMAMNQQRPEPSQPLFLFLATMHSQRIPLLPKTVEELIQDKDGNQLPVPEPPTKRLCLEQLFENMTFQIPVSEEQQEIARIPALSQDIPARTVTVSSVHAVPVPVSRPIDEPLQFSAAKMKQKKRTKVNHRDNPRTVKPGAYYAHQMRHDPFGPVSSRHRGESVAGDSGDMPFDPYDTKQGRREEKARIKRERKKMERENSSLWSTSMDDEIFEKEEEIEEEQRKAEKEWNESLGLSRSSLMLNLVPGNFKLDAQMQKRVQSWLQAQPEVAGVAEMQFSAENLQRVLHVATGQSQLITFSMDAPREVQHIQPAEQQSGDHQFAVPRVTPRQRSRGTCRAQSQGSRGSDRGRRSNGRVHGASGVMRQISAQ